MWSWVVCPLRDVAVEVRVVREFKVEVGVQHRGLVGVVVDPPRVLVCPERFVGDENSM